MVTPHRKRVWHTECRSHLLEGFSVFSGCERVAWEPSSLFSMRERIGWAVRQAPMFAEVCRWNDGIHIHQPGYCHLDLGHTTMAGSHRGLRNTCQVSESRTVALNSQSSPKLYDSLDSCSKSLADANFECRVRADTMFKTHENRCVCLKFCADFVPGYTFL